MIYIRKLIIDYKDQIIDMYYNQKKSCIEIADYIPFKYQSIYSALYRWGYTLRSNKENSKKYYCNDDYFKIIDNEEKAYWLGFIYADGYITDNIFGISLSTKDKKHLNKLNNILNSDYPINDYTSSTKYGIIKYSRLSFRNDKMVQDLINKGIVYNKSLILKFPNEDIIPKHLLKHFIRGYFDGDGSLVLSEKTSYNFKICGTKEFLKRIIDILNNELGNDFNYKYYKRKKDNKNNYYISYSGKQKTYKVMNYLYNQSSIYLDRKYKKYKNLCEKTVSYGSDAIEQVGEPVNAGCVSNQELLMLTVEVK